MQKQKIYEEYVSFHDLYMNRHVVAMGCFPWHQNGDSMLKHILVFKYVDNSEVLFSPNK